MEEIIIRAATKDDMEEVSVMIKELADYEKVEEGPRISAKDLQHDGFDESPPFFRCLVAERCGGLLGYAMYFPTYEAWQGRACMLRDLYLRPSVRQQGLGKRLFNAVAKEAVSWGSKRMEWHVLEWNPARAFYESRGAADLTGHESWRCYRLSGDALQQAAHQAH